MSRLMAEPPLRVIPGLDPRINRGTAFLAQIPGSSLGMTMKGRCHSAFLAILASGRQKLGFVENGVSCSSWVQHDLS
jgi:hypothetical protein